jgi:hypothetical protein
MLNQRPLKSKRAEHFCRPFVLTNPLNSIAKLEIYPTIKNYFFPMLISFYEYSRLVYSFKQIYE